MSVKRQDTGACPVCGRALSKWTTHVTLKSGEQVCRDCENVVRVKFPVTYGRKDKRYSEKRVDPLSDLTLGEFRAEMDKAVEYVEQLRADQCHQRGSPCSRQVAGHAQNGCLGS